MTGLRFVSPVTAGEAEPLALFAGRKLRQFPIDCGNTAVAAPAPDDWHDPILNLSQKIFAKLKYQGIGSIEYKMRDDGTPVIMEPTVGRTNWQNEIAVINGVDIPSIAYFDMIGSPELPPAVPVAPCKLVDGRAHRRAFCQQYRAGRLSVSQWLDERRGKKALHTVAPERPRSIPFRDHRQRDAIRDSLAHANYQEIAFLHVVIRTQSIAWLCIARNAAMAAP